MVTVFLLPKIKTSLSVEINKKTIMRRLVKSIAGDKKKKKHSNLFSKHLMT